MFLEVKEVKRTATSIVPAKKHSQLIERLTVLQRRKKELGRENLKLQTKVANSLR